MKNPLAGFFKIFQPRYSVVVNMYHVLPGSPVQKYSHKHDFGKGELDMAQSFFNNVVAKHTQLGFPNTEIHLIKGKKKVIDGRNYGPVDLVKNLNVQSVNAQSA